MRDLAHLVMTWWPLPLIVLQGVTAWALWSLDRRFVSRMDYARDQARRDERMAALEREILALMHDEALRAAQAGFG